MDRFIEPLWFGQLAVMAFFAIAFLQSAVDKLLDSQGNLDFLGGHFAASPLGNMVPLMFWVITVLETVTGLCCAVGFILLLTGAGQRGSPSPGLSWRCCLYCVCSSVSGSPRITPAPRSWRLTSPSPFWGWCCSLRRYELCQMDRGRNSSEA